MNLRPNVQDNLTNEHWRLCVQTVAAICHGPWMLCSARDSVSFPAIHEGVLEYKHGVAHHTYTKHTHTHTHTPHYTRTHTHTYTHASIYPCSCTDSLSNSLCTASLDKWLLGRSARVRGSCVHQLRCNQRRSVCWWWWL